MVQVEMNISGEHVVHIVEPDNRLLIAIGRASLKDEPIIDARDRFYDSLLLDAINMRDSEKLKNYCKDKISRHEGERLNNNQRVPAVLLSNYASGYLGISNLLGRNIHVASAGCAYNEIGELRESYSIYWVAPYFYQNGGEYLMDINRIRSGRVLMYVQSRLEPTQSENVTLGRQFATISWDQTNLLSSYLIV